MSQWRLVKFRTDKIVSSYILTLRFLKSRCFIFFSFGVFVFFIQNLTSSGELTFAREVGKFSKWYIWFCLPHFENVLFNMIGLEAVTCVFCKKQFWKISKNSKENFAGLFFFLTRLQAKGLNFIKSRLWHRCLLVNFTKFCRVAFL